MLGEKKVLTQKTSQCLAAVAGEKEHAIKIRSDVSKVSEIAKGNAIENQEPLRKLRDTPVTSILETSKQRLVTLGA